MQYDKPFLTYEEQIERLEKVYGLEIEEYKFAEYALSTFSYYDLVNAYKDIFMENGKFTPGLNIKYLTFFYLYDREFQSLIFRYSVMVENSFKAKMAYHLSEHYGVDEVGYLSPKNFITNNKSVSIFKVLSDIEYHAKKRYQNPTRYYVDKHNHIPAWILFKNITFADIISLYKLLKVDDKKDVTESVLTCNISLVDKGLFLAQALDLIRQARNTIAHNLNFVTFSSPKYYLPLGITKTILNDDFMLYGHKKLNNAFASIAAIYILLDNPFMKVSFLKDLQKTVSFTPLPIPIAQAAFEQIRRDYGNLIGFDVEHFVLQAVKQIPKTSPFK